MLLLTDTERVQGEAIMVRLLAEIGDIRFTWRGRLYDVTASLGMVEFDWRPD